MSVIRLAVRTLVSGDDVKGPDNGAFEDAVSAILSNEWFWLMQVVIVCGAATAGWLLARASEDSSHDTSLLPRHSQPGGSLAGYGSVAVTRAQAHDDTQIAALQAQVRTGKHSVSLLEARIDILEKLLRAAQADSGQANRLRAKARDDEILISSLHSQLSVSRAQTRDEKQNTSRLEDRVDTLSAALEGAQANVARLGAMRTSIQVSDSTICILNSQLDDLRAEGRNREDIISGLEQEVAFLTIALERAKLAASAEDQVSHTPVPVTITRCERCIPPVHITKAKAKGMWLRDQAKALNDEAGKLLFEAQNPDLVGARARLRNDMRIDLHHQFQKPAAQYVKNYATSARDQGLDAIIFIVGKGLHSEDNVPVLKPLVMQVLKGLDIEARTPERNSGEIVAKLQRRSG